MSQNVEIKSNKPEIRKFYEENGLDYTPTAEDRLHADFDRRTNGEQEIKIHQILRSKKSSFKSKENLWWLEVINSKDRWQNPIQKRYVVGKWEKPIGQFIYDEHTQRSKCVGVLKFE